MGAPPAAPKAVSREDPQDPLRPTPQNGDPPLFQLPPKWVWTSHSPQQTQGVNPHPPHLGGRLTPSITRVGTHIIWGGTHLTVPPPQRAPSPWQRCRPRNPPPPPRGGGGHSREGGGLTPPHTVRAATKTGGTTIMTPQTSHPLADTRSPPRGPMWGASTPLPAPPSFEVQTLTPSSLPLAKGGHSGTPQRPQTPLGMEWGSSPGAPPNPAAPGGPGTVPAAAGCI